MPPAVGYSCNYWSLSHELNWSFRPCLGTGAGDIAEVGGDPPYYSLLGRSSVDIIKHGGYKLSALQARTLGAWARWAALQAQAGCPLPAHARRRPLFSWLTAALTCGRCHAAACSQIESALLEHPDLLECAVVGLPDTDYGEVGGCIGCCPALPCSCKYCCDNMCCCSTPVSFNAAGALAVCSRLHAAPAAECVRGGGAEAGGAGAGCARAAALGRGPASQVPDALQVSCPTALTLFLRVWARCGWGLAALASWLQQLQQP